MAVTFYACVKLPIQIINEHGKTLVSEGESPHFCHLFQKHLPSYDSCEKMHISASKKAIDLGEAYIFACHADLNHIVYPLISKNVFLGSILVGPFLMILQILSLFLILPRSIHFLPKKLWNFTMKPAVFL